MGATARGIDLAKPLGERELGQVLLALGRYGVLRFPDQHLGLGNSSGFPSSSARSRVPRRRAATRAMNIPKSTSSRTSGRAANYIGTPDAGQDWHTDMTYREVPGFVNVLYGLRIPHRDGKSLGGTEFSNMRLAYEGLPAEIKTRLDGMTATHDIEKFWEHMRRVHNSPRPPMTDEQRRRRPPVAHPVFLAHPITGQKVLYCNPGFAKRINELPERESDEMLEYLFEHQLQPQFRWTNVWSENDLLIWDHLGTLHRAIADYRPDEIRLIRRCQVMATKVFDPDFLRPARELAAAGVA